jgi:hypothetical protein
MTLEERLQNNPPITSQANLNGGDKTPLEDDGGLNLSKDEVAITKAGGRQLGQGSAGHKPSSPYSDTFI